MFHLSQNLLNYLCLISSGFVFSVTSRVRTNKDLNKAPFFLFMSAAKFGNQIKKFVKQGNRDVFIGETDCQI